MNTKGGRQMTMTKWLKLHVLRIPFDSRMRLIYLVNYNYMSRLRLKFKTKGKQW
ncbi:MAG: hypothetical protein ABI162_06835 [Luteolibacter sp.]